MVCLRCGRELKKVITFVKVYIKKNTYKEVRVISFECSCQDVTNTTKKG